MKERNVETNVGNSYIHANGSSISHSHLSDCAKRDCHHKLKAILIRRTISRFILFQTKAQNPQEFHSDFHNVAELHAVVVEIKNQKKNAFYSSNSTQIPNQTIYEKQKAKKNTHTRKTRVNLQHFLVICITSIKSPC